MVQECSIPSGEVRYLNLGRSLLSSCTSAAAALLGNVSVLAFCGKVFKGTVFVCIVCMLIHVTNVCVYRNIALLMYLCYMC